MEYTLKKSLGQHFLHDDKICHAIVDAIPVCERLVEVGPGAGAITKYMLQILDCAAPFTAPFTVVGNFPYNISSQILFRVLEWKDQVPVMIGMFQKEVAKRIVSGPGNKDYGILSVLVQAYYTAEYLFDVPPTAFNPPPKVDSGVIQLTRRTDVVTMKSEKSFIAVVKAAFGQRRKMLRNPLKGMFTPETLQEEIFTKRPEQLSVADFAALTFKMK